jgi:hypothetical protein
VKIGELTSTLDMLGGALKEVDDNSEFMIFEAVRK